MKTSFLPQACLRPITVAILAALAAALLPEIADACPTCKDGLDTPEQQRMATGFFYSILFMMSMPFAILGTFGMFAYLSLRKARLEQEAAAENEV